MASLQQKLTYELIDAQKACQSAEYIVDVAYSLADDPRVLLRAMDSAGRAAVLAIAILLKVDHFQRKVSLGTSPELTRAMFFSQCALSHGLSEEDCKALRHLILLRETYQQSGFEFSVDSKAVIMNDALETFALDVEQAQKLVVVVKIVIDKARLAISSLSTTAID